MIVLAGCQHQLCTSLLVCAIPGYCVLGRFYSQSGGSHSQDATPPATSTSRMIVFTAASVRCELSGRCLLMTLTNGGKLPLLIGLALAR